MTDVVLFDIQKGSFVDGPGMRTTVFFKGCNLRCGWCHNPESQSPLPQLLYDRTLCTQCGLCEEVCENPDRCILCGTCADYCPSHARKLCGKRWTVEQVLEQILSDRIFYKTTGGGVTFSGGECMLQPDGLSALLERCHGQGIHTAVDTAGHVPWQVFQRILPWTDLFLYDVKALDSRTHKAHTGADNRLILENLARLLGSGKDVIIRIPVVEGVNADPKELRTLLKLLRSWGTPRSVELLPCHSMGTGKLRALGRTPRDYRAPRPEAWKELENIVSQEGF